jgi:hypothetical protein
MRKIAFLILTALIVTSCANQNTTTSDLAPNSVAPQRAIVNESSKTQKYTNTNLNLSFNIPQGTTVTDEPSPPSTAKISLKFPDMQPSESFSVQTRPTQPTKQELEDLDTDNYNGSERTYGTTKATCYTRWNKYLKDQYKFKSLPIPTYPDTGYRLDCFAKISATTWIYLTYRNEIDDFNLYRTRQTIAEDILSSL